MSEFIFVYGTLRTPRHEGDRQARNHSLIQDHVISRRPAQMTGVLMNLGPFPMAIQEQGNIIGELLEVEPEALKVTDRLEGHPTLYFRAETEVVTDDDEIYTAWVYWAGKRLQESASSIIRSGDWFNP